MKKVFPVQYYRDIVNAITEPIMLVGLDGAILLANDAMVSLTGFNRKELVGSHCTILNCDACEPDQVETTGKWCKLFDIGLMEDKNCIFIRKDGSCVPVLKNARILHDAQGEVIGILETFKELSEKREKDQLKTELTNLIEEDTGFFGMVGTSAAMQHIYRVIVKAAQVDSPVIIYGDSGTGKELASYAIHKLGPRKDEPFVRCNCAALNESLLESELFGHVKGAFTGAYHHREGRFQAAHGGDLFLDEIGDVPLSAQTKLLRVLETKQFERVGDHRPIEVDVRIISATNRNLQQMINENGFREDLFYRINVVPIRLPPLKERKEDIPLLVSTFTNKLRAKTQKDIDGVSDDVLELFFRYDWPGNIRELRSTLEYAFVLAETKTIEPHNLPETVSAASFAQMHRELPSESVITGHNDHERSALVKALQASKGNKAAAARILGVHRMTVWNRMRKYGIRLNKDVQRSPSERM